MKVDVAADPAPMRRALAFCKDIRSSKLIQHEFREVVEEYLDYTDADGGDVPSLECEIEHVDGTFNAKTRGALLDWLKADPDEHMCRILTNARCLSEGVDVPALDAIMFLHPRKSQIDVVQSVGRVMRRAEGKKMGYVILPVGVPAGIPPEQALNDNQRYRVVWQILNALRAHDDRFDATINKASLGQDVSGTIEIIGVTQNAELDAVTAVVTDLPVRAQPARASIGKEGREATLQGDAQMEFGFSIDEFSRAIMAKIVKKCGTRDYWEDWATNIAQIASNHITRLTSILAAPNTAARIAFDQFHKELKEGLNSGVTESDAVEMLAQHIITRPVFEVLFEGHKFTDQNPVSRAMQQILAALDESHLDKESRDLQNFYASVQNRARGITDPRAKQRLIVELYEKFFKKAFPLTTDRLGIVYTPVEIVDFIIRSVNDVLTQQFGQSIGARGVHIIDPFTGTGTFITRLMQSGLLTPTELEHKYRHEIHANEIVLLAYYIAAINIEAVYHGLSGGEYAPFDGICLADTFQMYETGDLISSYMPDNSERRRRQKAQDIRVIFGNPPYSGGQSNANDNNANVQYPSLDSRIRNTYAARSTNTNKRALYDSYMRAFRWASDRIGDAGVVAFVSNAGWIDGNTTDGMRACLVDEFSSIYVFHLRGNQRTSGDVSRREGGKIFGSGSRAPIAITILVKNPACVDRGKILFRDVGDYLSREQKLAEISRYASIDGISQANAWASVQPDKHNDWLGQRDVSYENFILASEKNPSEPTLFDLHTRGVQTTRDAWCFNFSRHSLWATVQRAAESYNSFAEKRTPGGTDSTEFSWCQKTRGAAKAGKKYTPDSSRLFNSDYRPFTRSWLFTDGFLNWSAYRTSSLFPTDESNNLAIGVPSRGFRGDFSALMCSRIPGLYFASTDCSEFFPLRIYDGPEDRSRGLFSSQTSARDGISDQGFQHFCDQYPGEHLTKDDIFYYVYGLFHSPEYRRRYAENLKKELPRIPCVKKAEDFWSFSRAGRALGDLHVNYESAAPYPVTFKEGDLRLADIKDAAAFFRVTDMKFAGGGKNRDKSTVIYNSNITMQDIPLEAYEYVVNGKSALEWVMERQTVSTDRASGIVNDANLYATETVGNPAYPLELFQRVITVSLETIKIVKSLPKLDIDQ